MESYATWVILGMQIYTTIFQPFVQTGFNFVLEELRATNCCRKKHVYDSVRRAEELVVEIPIKVGNETKEMVCTTKSGRQATKEKLILLEKQISQLIKEI